LFFACLLAGWALQVIHPLALPFPRTLRFSGGTVVCLAAAIFGAWGLRTFKRHATTHRPNGVASTLLTTGPFRLSRNPLYCALVSLLLGFSLLLHSAWLLMLTPLLCLLLDRLVIAKEEARLRAQFGANYTAYTQRVRRWL
jgi:protein-S-isoprenylcysteine O-methyltransferase Ste14